MAEVTSWQRVIHGRIDRAGDDKLVGQITEEYWLRRSNEWQEELAEVRVRLRDLENPTFKSFSLAGQI